MHSRSLIAILATAQVVLAATPQGFRPSSDTDLIVAYANALGDNGAVLERNSTQLAPRIAMTEKLSGTYAVLMIDLDIPTDNPPETNTLLHWMQTGLTSANASTALNVSSGSGTECFVLENRQRAAPLAEYLGPNPPARVPLSHRYTFVLVDHSDITDDGLATLQSAAQSRRGFNAEEVLTEAGLSDKVVAGNFFNVTNGDSDSSGGGSGVDSSNGTASLSSPSATATTTGSPAASSALEAAASTVSSSQARKLVFWLGVVGGGFLAL